MNRRDAMLTMISSVAFASAGCSSAKGGGKQIAVIPKGTSHDFWKSVRYGAVDAAKGSEYSIKWLGTTDEKDKKGQIEILDNLIRQQVDGICLAPIDRDALMQPIEQAKQAGIPVVIFDSGIRDPSKAISYVATNNRHGGEVAGEHLAKVMGGKGGVIMLRYQAGSESTEQREEGFLSVMKKYKDITILSESQRVDSNAESAKEISSTLLRANKDKLHGVFTVCEPNNKGMLTALVENKLAGKVKFVAFDSDPQMIDGLKAGTVDGVVLQNPVKMGHDSVEAILKHLKGEKVDARIETGEELATPQNMNEPKFAALLKPEQFND